MPDQDITWNTRIQQKKDTDANWTSNDPVLLKNELIIVEMESGECRFKIGDGTSSYTELPFIASGFSGVLGIEQGGTGGTDRNSARNKLGVPAQIGVDPSLSFPIGYGLLSSRGSLGNTAGSVPATDNYYYGVDMQAVLWGGAQVNGASNPIFYRAMMMNGEQRFQLLYSGSLYNGNSTTLADGYKYACLLIGASPNGTTFGVHATPAGSIGAMRILGVDGYYLDIALEINNPAINLRVYGGNNSGGRITYIWGILKHSV